MRMLRSAKHTAMAMGLMPIEATYLSEIARFPEAFIMLIEGTGLPPAGSGTTLIPDLPRDPTGPARATHVLVRRAPTPHPRLRIRAGRPGPATPPPGLGVRRMCAASRRERRHRGVAAALSRAAAQRRLEALLRMPGVLLAREGRGLTAWMQNARGGRENGSADRRGTARIMLGGLHDVDAAGVSTARPDRAMIRLRLRTMKQLGRVVTQLALTEHGDDTRCFPGRPSFGMVDILF